MQQKSHPRWLHGEYLFPRLLSRFIWCGVNGIVNEDHFARVNTVPAEDVVPNGLVSFKSVCMGPTTLARAATLFCTEIILRDASHISGQV